MLVYKKLCKIDICHNNRELFDPLGRAGSVAATDITVQVADHGGRVC